MTPYKRAGYKAKIHGDDHDTKFRLLRDAMDLKKDDVVILAHDDGTCSPRFIRADGVSRYLNLPVHGDPGIEPVPDTNENETLDEVLRMVRAVCLGDKVKVDNDCYASVHHMSYNNITKAARTVMDTANCINSKKVKYTLLSEHNSAKIEELEKKKAEAIAEFDKQIEELRNEH